MQPAPSFASSSSMPGQADAWWEDLRQEAELPPAAPRSKTPVILGAIAAIFLSGSLAWWLTSPDDGGFRNPAITQVRPQVEPVRIANPAADQEQVRRAYEEFATVYANSGAEGLARFQASCEASLKGDPRILDFCLAFDLFADAVRADTALAGKDDARRLALVRASLPAGADPDGRIQDVRRLMRLVTGGPEAPPVDRAVQTEPARPASPALQKASALAPAAVAKLPTARPRPASKALARACRLGSTAADRIVCANPALEAEHRRMRLAYERALAAGADPLLIDRSQADWRAAREGTVNRNQLSALYARRIRELEAAATAPSRPAAPAQSRAPEEPPI
jgi:hypothetical protein